MTQLHLELDQLLRGDGDEVPDIAQGTKILSLDLGKSAQQETSLIRLAHRDRDIRGVLVQFIARGFLPYRQQDSVVYLVADWHVGDFWHRVKNGDLGVTEDGLVFSIEEPKLSSVACSKLVVVFSSMAADPFQPSLMRYFEQNYRSLGKFLSGDVAILRIADIGGVVGGFYLNTRRNPDAIGAIQRLIQAVREDFGVSPDRTILYGASKGGTGALLHGMLGDYRVISVDPIVDDRYYEENHNDSHFSGDDLFCDRKVEVFERAMSDNLESMSSPIVLITAPKSPQYDYISKLLESGMGAKTAVIESTHPEILDHPDVSAKTMPFIPALINGLDLGLWPAAGMHRIKA